MGKRARRDTSNIGFDLLEKKQEGKLEGDRPLIGEEELDGFSDLSLEDGLLPLKGEEVIGEHKGGRKKTVAKAGAKEIVALHLTDEAVFLMYNYFNGKSYTVNKFEIVPIEKEEITEENVFKEPDPAKLHNSKITAIDKAFKDAGISKKHQNIVTSLGGRKIVLKQISVDNETFENIEEQLPNLVVNPFEGTFNRYEYLYLGTRKDNGVVKHSLLVAVVDSQLFFSVQKLLDDAGVNANILDLDITATLNLYLEVVKPQQNVVECILDIGALESYVIIHSTGNEELYVRSIDFTYNRLRSIIAKNRNFSLAEAEQMIQSRNFYDYVTKTFEKETEESLNSSYNVGKYIKTNLLDELKKTFVFYTKQSKNKAPSAIYIGSRGLDIHKFTNFITNTTEFKCENLDVASAFQGDESLKRLVKDHASTAFTVFGLGLRYD